MERIAEQLLDSHDWKMSLGKPRSRWKELLSNYWTLKRGRFL
jgi:hypothetical protein